MLPWREAARALLVDGDRVLLVHFTLGVWALPGGGVHAGETHEQALARELREEVGLEGAAIGPCVWLRDHVFPAIPGFAGQHERIYLVRVAAFAPRPLVDLAAEHVSEIRWWTYAEVQASRAAFWPGRFPELWRDLREAVPATPIEVGH